MSNELREKKDALIVGAGLTGMTIARILAEAGKKVTLIDERLHLAGNCHTRRDPETGIMVHTYGPHCFRTNDKEVWSFLRKHSAWFVYNHKVRAVCRDKVFSMPINLMTLSQVWGKAFTPEEGAALLESVRVNIENPANFE